MLVETGIERVILDQGRVQLGQLTELIFLQIIDSYAGRRKLGYRGWEVHYTGCGLSLGDGIFILIIIGIKMAQIDYKHANEVLRSAQGHVLYIGDASAAEDIAWLRQANIKTVITVASGFRISYDPTIKHITYALEDRKTENFSVHFDMGAFQIDKYLKNSNLLVHCGAGVSRSATLVIAYLLRYKSMTFLAALKLLKSKRPQVCPNLGFQLQLKAYEKQLHSMESVSLMMKKEKKQLPDIIKYNPSTTENKPFHRNYKAKDNTRLLNRSMKSTESREHKEFEYLKKIAQFRFGITNMSRWKISDSTSDNFKRIYQH